MLIYIYVSMYVYSSSILENWLLQSKIMVVKATRKKEKKKEIQWPRWSLTVKGAIGLDQEACCKEGF